MSEINLNSDSYEDVSHFGGLIRSTNRIVSAKGISHSDIRFPCSFTVIRSAKNLFRVLDREVAAQLIVKLQ